MTSAWINRSFLAIAFSVVIAEQCLAGYVPPKRLSVPKGPTTTTGRRGGCDGSAPASLVALAPTSHVGVTATAYPTLSWFVPGTQSYDLIFQLYAGELGEDLVYSTNLSSSSGLMQLTLPESTGGLKPNQRYSWEVVLLCDPNSPSSSLLAGAQIEYQPDLALKVPGGGSNVERSNTFAQMGAWYDAFALDSDRSGQITPQQARLLESLIPLESNSKNPLLPSHGEQLQQTISSVSQAQPES